MTQNSKFTLAYTRTARAEVDQPNESIIRQKEAIYKFAKNNGYIIVKYVEQIRSGKCNDFRWLYNILFRDKKIRHVLIYSPDRLARSYPDCAHLVWYLNAKFGVSVEVAVKSDVTSLINLHTTNRMTQQLKNALCYIRSTSPLPKERELSVAYQKDVIIPFALSNGFDIVDFLNDLRAETDKNNNCLDEYFSNAHKTVKHLLVFSIERLGSDVWTGIEVAKYLHEKYGVKVISALQPQMDFATINPDDIYNH